MIGRKAERMEIQVAVRGYGAAPWRVLLHTTTRSTKEGATKTWEGGSGFLELIALFNIFVSCTHLNLIWSLGDFSTAVTGRCGLIHSKILTVLGSRLRRFFSALRVTAYRVVPLFLGRRDLSLSALAVIRWQEVYQTTHWAKSFCFFTE